MITGASEYPALWGALLVLNWPVYTLIYRQVFSDKRDLKASVLAALKPSIFWKGEESWSAGKFILYFLVCGLAVWFEYEILCAIVSSALS